MPPKRPEPVPSFDAKPRMSAQEFVAKWRPYTGKETSGYASHFDDLCRLVGHETPTEADPAQSFFCFQKAVQKDNNRPGFADVYFQRYFGWEYKGNYKDLDAAYRQLLQYRENLENPPLLIVSDFSQVIIRTNFNNTVTRTIRVTLDDLLSDKPVEGSDYSAIEILRLAFYDPGRLNPGLTPEKLTLDAAAKFGLLADYLRGLTDSARRSKEDIGTPEEIARFLTRLIFCLFAGDVGLLPAGLLARTIRSFRNVTPDLNRAFSELFQVMSTGGPFGGDRIPYFDGGLFSDNKALDLYYSETEILLELDQMDWSSIEPSIFGTLFERILDPSRRGQLGAHYTSRTDIETIVRPVLMEPLEREWETLKPKLDRLSLFITGAGIRDRREQARALLQRFLDRLALVTVLDPACGSGNFLYVSLALLKDLEQRVVSAGAAWNVTGLKLKVHPRQLFGIEIDHYAHELASMVVWIGYLQWKHKAGIPLDEETPILEPLTNIALVDAVLDTSDAEAGPKEPKWPQVDVIVGNPPFLGGKRLRSNLGDGYVDALFRVWDGRVRREADFCVYWHEKARAQIEAGLAKRAGLLSTQSIRGGANRPTLARIKETGDIFFAVSDRPWVLDGAAVHVSMVGFDDGSETRRVLDGVPVEGINANLTSQLDMGSAVILSENANLSFMGDTKVGPFDIPEDMALSMLKAVNPDGRLNNKVVRPWVNGLDITRRPRKYWIVDFPPGTSVEEAALYEAPFEYIQAKVKPMRAEARSGDATGVAWWIHQRPRPEMRRLLAGSIRYVATPNLTKYRFYVWLSREVLPDHQLIVFARDDDYFFGVLHSRIHELWARAQGTQLREVESGFRYTPTTCFETFPLPWPPGKEPAGDPLVTAIALAAAELDRPAQRLAQPAAGLADGG